MEKIKDKTLYASPFCAGFWKSAAAEIKSTRTLAFAALFVALRIAVKSLSVPISEGLYISVDFFVNSVGSMVYGPLMGLIVGAVSDTVGAVLFPKGAYFFPFIAVEMLSSFIFGLFLYRSKLGEVRVALSRVAVSLICNILVNPVIMKWYYAVVLGKDYAVFRAARVVKSLVLLPAEMILLVLWVGAASAITERFGLTYSHGEKPKITAKSIIIAVLATAVAVLCIVYYLAVYLKK